MGFDMFKLVLESFGFHMSFYGFHKHVKGMYA